MPQVVAAAVEAPAQQLDWEALATEMDGRSPLEIMDHVSGVGWGGVLTADTW